MLFILPHWRVTFLNLTYAFCVCVLPHMYKPGVHLHHSPSLPPDTHFGPRQRAGQRRCSHVSYLGLHLHRPADGHHADAYTGNTAPPDTVGRWAFCHHVWVQIPNSTKHHIHRCFLFKATKCERRLSPNLGQLILLIFNNQYTLDLYWPCWPILKIEPNPSYFANKQTDRQR